MSALRVDRHPRDELGRPIPDAGWPAGKEAPGRLEVLRRFVNTTNRESGADHLASAPAALRWLRAEGWAVAAVRTTDLDRLVTVREVLRALAARNRTVDTVDTEEAAPGGGWARLVELTGGSVAVAVEGAGPTLRGQGRDVEHVLTELVAIAVEARLTGTWDRLRACRNASCGWIVYDRTRNATATWCSMSACGQRHKQRAYRRRLAAQDHPR